MTTCDGPDRTIRESYYESLTTWSGQRIVLDGPDGRVAAIFEPDSQDPQICHVTLMRPIPGLDQDASWRCLPGADVERWRPEAP